MLKIFTSYCNYLIFLMLLLLEKSLKMEKKYAP